MKEAKHTPGPWRMECGEDVEAWADYFPVVLAEGYCIVGNEGMYGDRDTDIANARLIAAAPELLEALLSARDHIDMNALEVSHCKDAEKIRQAISKATGA